MRHDYNSNPVAIMKRDQSTDIKITCQIVTSLQRACRKAEQRVPSPSSLGGSMPEFVLDIHNRKWFDSLDSIETTYFWGALETPSSNLRNKLFTAALF